MDNDFWIIIILTINTFILFDIQKKIKNLKEDTDRLEGLLEELEKNSPKNYYEDDLENP